MLLKYLGNVMPQQVSTILNLKKKIDQCVVNNDQYTIQIVIIIIKIYFKNIKYILTR